MHRPKAGSRDRKESHATGSSRHWPTSGRSRSGAVLAGPQVVGGRWAPCAGYASPRAPQATAVTVNGSEGTRRRQASRSVMRWSASRLAK